MRVTSVLRTLLALHQTRVVAHEFTEEALIVDVVPSWQLPRCSGCGKKRRSVYDSRVRVWRHLDFGGIKILLRYRIRRVSCKKCGVVVESVPWAESGSRFTLPMEGHIAYHAQRTDKTTVSTLMRVAWRIVGQIIKRYVHRERKEMGDPLENLRTIGVDEISYRKHHEYITTVVDHERGIVVWAGKGKSAETLKGFFEMLGEERAKKIESVTIDMSSAYIKAVRESVPNATLIFDRFHVQRLLHDALDEVRRDEVRAAAHDEKAGLKKTRWALQKNPWNLTDLEKAKLADFEAKNLPIYRAYLLKESLLEILDRRQVNVAARKLDEWIDWAQASGLPPFVRAANTIQRHLDGILAYVRTRLNNGRVEGLNGKAGSSPVAPSAFIQRPASSPCSSYAAAASRLIPPTSLRTGTTKMSGEPPFAASEISPNAAFTDRLHLPALNRILGRLNVRHAPAGRLKPRGWAIPPKTPRTRSATELRPSLAETGISPLVQHAPHASRT